MTGFELAKRRVEAGYRLRFYQDFYGKQWVKVTGSWLFWRNKKIYLDNQEIVAFKKFIAQRRKVGVGVQSGLPGVADAA